MARTSPRICPHERGATVGLRVGVGRIDAAGVDVSMAADGDDDGLAVSRGVAAAKQPATRTVVTATASGDTRDRIDSDLTGGVARRILPAVVA
jgi:hypothetical protein